MLAPGKRAIKSESGIHNHREEPLAAQVVVFALGVGSTESHVHSLASAVQEASKQHTDKKAAPTLPDNTHELDEALHDDFMPQMTPREALAAEKTMYKFSVPSCICLCSGE